VLAYALVVQGGGTCTTVAIISNVQGGTLASLMTNASLTLVEKMRPAAAHVEGPSLADFAGSARGPLP
jgi:hypothetical protein